MFSFSIFNESVNEQLFLVNFAFKAFAFFLMRLQWSDEKQLSLELFFFN